MKHETFTALPGEYLDEKKYHHELNGRSVKYDWETVDWTQTNPEIAALIGAPYSLVHHTRKRLG